MKLIAFWPQLQELYLNYGYGKNPSEHHWYLFTRAKTSNLKVFHVEMHYAYFSDKCFINICEALRKSQVLTYILIDHSSSSSKRCKIRDQALASFNTLKLDNLEKLFLRMELKLQNSSTSSDFFEKVFQCRRLKYLVLKLGVGLYTNKLIPGNCPENLVSINFSGVNFAQQGLFDIFTTFRKLENFILDLSHWTEDKLLLVIDEIVHMPMLKILDLDLSTVNVSAKGTKAIANLMSMTLERLSISFYSCRSITDEAVLFFMDGFTGCPKLNSLYFNFDACSGVKISTLRTVLENLNKTYKLSYSLDDY
eukprot:TRINITY_DN20575_c0_g1_i1.p1 TRINITY_DN20575_c0_g1~~TRINITY_DN20575_c0_g1_i1.p1  ORF type:complete len:308 (+),score=16.46 TRINITY_DN20575_c0_g1_i1:85-1008(+)